MARCALFSSGLGSSSDPLWVSVRKVEACGIEFVKRDNIVIIAISDFDNRGVTRLTIADLNLSLYASA